MDCFSGRLMSAASDQKLFCKLYSPLCCSFNEFVEEKVITRPIPPPSWLRPSPYLFIFALISIALGDWPKKLMVWFTSENVLAVFSSRSFMVSCLWAILSSFFSMVWGCVLMSLIYILLFSFPNTTCWRNSFLHCIFLRPLSNINLL